jgi:predicted RNA-binding protein YlxR (DUF448 family)
LAVGLDGSKLRPLVVFKAKPDGSVAKILGNLDGRNEYICQENAYCDKDVMSHWISKCLKPHHKSKVPALIMMDNFKAHLVSSVRKELAENGWLQLNLPANMTSRVQILDVGVNKPFKDRMRSYYNQFLIDNHGTAKVTRVEMAKWVAEAWEDLPRECIVNTSKKIGFI